MIEGKEKMKDYYKDQKVVDEYVQNRFKTPIGKNEHTNQVNIVNQIIKKKKIEKILEIACGPGRITKHIKAKGKAMDSSKQMIKLAEKELEGWELKQGDAFNLEYKKEEFELVYTFRFIRHFKKEERKKIYAEIHKVLKPKGILIFDAVNYKKNKLIRKIVGEKNYHIYDVLYNKKQLIKELKENGFKVIALKGNIKHFYTEILISKISNIIGLNKIATWKIKQLEKIGGKNPLGWTVIAQRE